MLPTEWKLSTVSAAFKFMYPMTGVIIIRCKRFGPYMGKRILKLATCIIIIYFKDVTYIQLHETNLSSANNEDKTQDMLTNTYNIHVLGTRNVGGLCL